MIIASKQTQEKTMRNIDPKFLHADGTINYEAAMTAGRKARSQAAKSGFIAVCDFARELFKADNQISDAVKQPDPSREGAAG